MTPYEIESIYNTVSFYRDYSVYPHEKDVMFASFHDGNIPKHLFSSKYPGQQNMAITLAAIAKTVMEDIMDWKPRTLDSIIIIGSKLHQTRITQRQMLNYTFTLEIRHLPTTISNNGKEICDVTYGNPVYGILKANRRTMDGKRVKSLDKVLSECFLSTIQGVILKIQGFCMGIMRNEIGHWYVFDSYPKDFAGRYSRFGKASLIKFCRCKTLTHYIENEFLWALPFTAVPVQMVLCGDE